LLQRIERLQLLVGEVDEREPLPPSGTVVNAAQVDAMNDLGVGGMQRCHGLEVSGKHQAAFSVVLPFPQMSRCIGHTDESDLDVRIYGHPIELLLPVTGRHLIINQDDEVDPQRPAPSDDYLAVDETVIDPAEHDGHQGILIDFSPAAMARVAASSGESVRWNTKSTSIARFTPVTTLTEGSPRSRFNTAKEQEPLARSTNTTAGMPRRAASTRSSSVSRSHPVFDTGTSAPEIPLICSAACTSAPAREAWQTTPPSSSSLIVLLEVLPDSTLLLHSLDQAGIESRGDIHSRVAQQVHHGHDLGDDRDVLSGIERDHNPGNRHIQNGGLLPRQTAAVAILGGLPILQLHHHLDPLLLAHRAHAEQRRNVDQANAPNFHMMRRQLVPPADQHVVPPASHLHYVVGDEAVAPLHQIQ